MKTLVYALLATIPLSAGLAATPFSQTWTYSTPIPDNDDVGAAFTQVLANLDITDIHSVSVAINLAGGWNGDLFAYLAHGDGMAVLLNRAGMDDANPDGAGSLGLNITFRDDAAFDIHTSVPMSGGPVTGTFQPDGRATDPLIVRPSDARPAMLSGFNGMSANGHWTLYLADQSTGATSTLQSWSLTIEGVPEPSTPLLAALSLLTLWRRSRNANTPLTVELARGGGVAKLAHLS
ncbi:MAG: PEP-CTERM sorting domain-containing protein [Verrucomicrobia bacterium]|nr:PEP-CTERM sorting domain-containing protein [Verrucomicrobiota bacterium]